MIQRKLAAVEQHPQRPAVARTGIATARQVTGHDLDPATHYPQLEPWFQRFAGTAFRWQDAPTPQPGATASASAPVFAQAPSGNAASGGGVIRFTQ